MQLHEIGGSAELKVFIVEDNPVDVLLFRRILKKSSLAYSLTVVADGTEAIEQLKQGTAGEGRYRPDVVFLDLNLPGLSGTDILAAMKADMALAEIRVAVLTGSDEPDDFTTCTRLGVDAFFNKAVAVEDFLALAANIESFLQSLPILARRQSTPHFRAAATA